MRELNQLLLNFDIKRTFNDHDYYVADSNYFASEAKFGRHVPTNRADV